MVSLLLWESDKCGYKTLTCVKCMQIEEEEEEEEARIMMSEKSKMVDLRLIEEEMIKKKSDDSSSSKKHSNSIGHGSNSSLSSKKQSIDTRSALQSFLDHIPISSIPGIKNSPVVELRSGDSVRDAIELLYKKNVSGAPITTSDVLESAHLHDVSKPMLSDRYIGFIDLSTMLLWSLEKCEKAHIHDKIQVKMNGFFSMLDQNPQIGQTKVGELAKSFLWDPFFPVHLDETLFRVLLLLSKHRLHVVPVTDRSNPLVTGFVTQNAVIQLLLQSSGLDWFDSIANKSLSEFRYEHEEHDLCAYGDQSLTEAIDILRRSKNGAIAAINRATKTVIGSIRRSDVHLLLDDDLFNNRKYVGIDGDRSLTVEEFVHLDVGKTDSDPTSKQDLGALLSTAGTLRLKSGFYPRMDSPVINRKTDSLKQAMEKLAETNSNFSFLVDDSQHQHQQLSGLLTLRDVIIQFAPPCMDSRINGGGFFDFALEQAGCHVKKGTVVCEH